MSLNDEQQAHVESLARNPDKVCGCGWFFKTECAMYCHNKGSQLPEQRAIREHGNFRIRRAIDEMGKLINEYYPLKDIPEYYHDNQYRRNCRFILERAKKKLEGLLDEDSNENGQRTI